METLLILSLNSHVKFERSHSYLNVHLLFIKKSSMKSYLSIRGQY